MSAQDRPFNDFYFFGSFAVQIDEVETRRYERRPLIFGLINTSCAIRVNAQQANKPEPCPQNRFPFPNPFLQEIHEP